MRVSDERHHSDETSGDVHMRETRRRCGHLHPHRSDQLQTSTREFPHLRGVNKGRGRGAMCSRTSSTVHARPADATLGAPNLGTRGSFQIWAREGPSKFGHAMVLPNLGTHPKFGLRSARRSGREAAAWPAAVAACSGRAAAHTPEAHTDPPLIVTLSRRPPEAHQSSSQPR